MKHVFVTGAGGYIGSVLVPKLLDEGYQVTGLDRFFFGDDKLQGHPQLKIIRDDSRRYNHDVLEGVDFVIDLVAISNDPSGELFQTSTNQINFESRASTAAAAKERGVKRYILPSSCSIYGFQEKGVKVDEGCPTNPLTTYAKANENAEKHVLPLADDSFTVTVMRQATVFGYSPRMRFDLAINGMVCGAMQTGKIPLLRDGTQYRPFVHIQDTTDVMCLLLKADSSLTNGQIFNVGSDKNNYELLPLAEEVQQSLPIEVGIEWYGDPDHRSYQACFDKIEKVLNWQAKRQARDGAIEVYEKIKEGFLKKTTQTITLEWYKELAKWNDFFYLQKKISASDEEKRWDELIGKIRMYEGVVDI